MGHYQCNYHVFLCKNATENEKKSKNIQQIKAHEMKFCNECSNSSILSDTFFKFGDIFNLGF